MQHPLTITEKGRKATLSLPKDYQVPLTDLGRAIANSLNTPDDTIRAGFRRVGGAKLTFTPALGEYHTYSLALGVGTTGAYLEITAQEGSPIKEESELANTLRTLVLPTTPAQPALQKVG